MNIEQSRFYYHDSLLREFSGRVIEATEHDGAWHVTLNRTAFYPTSGGQPHDTGRLGERRVLDVFLSGSAVIHVLDGPLRVDDEVRGEIDWERRFDHMQHHTGQHILSAAFEQLWDVDTVGFHLGPDVVTLDLARDDLAPQDIWSAELLANQVIWDDRLVHATFVEPANVANYRLRRPPKVTEHIRIVSIDGFDDNACGGTHVTRTGQVGQIQVLRWERSRGGLRLTLVCGKRALLDHRAKNEAVRTLGQTFSVADPVALVEAVERQQELMVQSRKRETVLRQQLADAQVDALMRQVTSANDGTSRVIAFVGELQDTSDLKRMLSGVMERLIAPATCILAGIMDGRVHLVMACSGGVRHAGATVKDVLTQWNGKGGGTAELAQGSAALDETLSDADIVRALTTACP